MQIQEGHKKRIVFILLLTAFLCGILSGCGKTDIPEEIGSRQIETLEDLAGKKVAVMTGSFYETKALEYLPDSILDYYQTTPDCFLAVEEGKADALVVSSLFFASALEEYPNLKPVGSLCDADLYYGTTKSEFGLQIRNDLTEYLNKEWDNGGQQALLDSWKSGEREATPMDFDSLTGDKGTIRCAVEPLDLPYACQVEGGFSGIEAENLYNFCKEYGYRIDFQTLDWSSILASVVTGKLDLCMYTYYSTERAEKILYTVPYEKSQVIVAVKDLSDASGGADGNTSEAYASLTEQTADAETTLMQNHLDALADKYTGKKIGVIPGTIFDRIAEECFPESSIEYINSSEDIALALESGQIEAYISDEPTFRMIQKTYDDHYPEAALESISYRYIFPKGELKNEQLSEQLDSYLTKLRESGTLSDLFEIWIGDDESKKVVDYSGITGENGELTLGVSTDIGAPFAYVQYNQYVGYDVDIAVRFCKEYGYSLKISDTTFSGLLAGVADGKYDFGGSAIAASEKRAETLDFSVPNLEGSIVLVTKNRQETDTTVLSDVSEYEKLSGMKIGVLDGTFFDEFSQSLIPDCQQVFLYSNADMALALENGAIDAYMTDQPIARALLKQYPYQSVFAVASQDSYGYIFPKNSRESDYLRAQMNGFLQGLREEKTLREIDGIWFGDDESKKVVDFSGLTGINGELTMAVTSRVGEPFCYLKDGRYVGYDVDIAVRFCREYGYSLTLVEYDFSELIDAVSAGECDFGGSCITITEERKEFLNFTDPNYDGGVVIVVRDTLALEDADRTAQTLWQSVQNSFRKTFLRENRWKMFVNGIGITMLITIVSAVCGTVVGFLVFLLYRKKNRLPNAAVNILSDFLRKMPVVVILMILYYLVFAKSHLSGMVVSCIGFSMIFACSVLGCLKLAAGAVDNGQMEAALALGYSDTRAFLRVILPQAMQHFLPAYQEEIVSLIKETAVVGYIAVQDLTSVSDIIRSRTYEAFFPLIASALVYFAIAWILALLVQHIRIRSNPKRRSSKKVLKGVRTI